MQTVLITGASAGLGLALAKELQRGPYQLVLTARESSMPRFAAEGFQESDTCLLRVLDVVDPEARQDLVSELTAKVGGVDVLVNNAGISYRAVVEHLTERERLAQMKVNFRGPMDLVRLVLPGMRARRSGRILNVSSVGGMMAMPTMAVYSASKFALEGASEALYYEVKPWNIHVTLVQPGFIKSTGFERVRYTPMSSAAEKNPDDPYHQHYVSMGPFIGRLMKRTWSTPERVARKMRRIIEAKNPPLRAPVTPDAIVFYGLRRWLPRRTYHWFLYRNLPSVKTWGPGAED